ncbi:MAG: SUMF1/EgtB/PvdO family nonheme iron enzyme [Candidatus Aminicenantes bacterium]|nr:SUMF1/EgtB/PvdO family nonheme iron enzyme [Candidatus Aminicenantes bacterium]NIM80146.1 SUMF1/EgtB/PvdO family nonheme iron enzyme [Candidatus Aminicenantes bacterium]NIN19484.1 SUMF1/EgtB/PvdO family nonheme iron enzyme [Candidatus Aminicenantes bacterium]NIN43383.1 SUMF1/EgtB/PvdO family nonheme iron enzyme [Candidatus Aminicenantes bacterium]NIN86128.1 SUMF1/EgtB/PvdO family nonheme iron enzyme [Candidatus Aminicenantes bacterium]
MAGRSAKEKYTAVLRQELGFIDLLGSPDIESKTVNLDEAFVSLRISESWRCEDRFGALKKQKNMPVYREERYLSPEEVMKRAFQKYKLLLVIGDPGSGKTTLMKYYAVVCLDRTTKKNRQLGFTQEILPLYFPLRELEFDEQDEPSSLPENLAKWTDKRLLRIPAEQFFNWLQEENTLVMLDGLDEISSMERRQNVCRWIETMSKGLLNACFVVTSRYTGYRKLDGIELEVPHLRADIMDFSPQQQADFLKKWFRAVFLAEMPPKDEGVSENQWKQRQEQRADRQSDTIIRFLKSEDNKAVQELAAVPMLLQIMAIIWKDREHLPESRSELYDAALNYLLDYRDRRRKLKPLLRAEKARIVLTAVGLWMQEKLKKDEVYKGKMHLFMQPILDTLDERPSASAFCNNLNERAGLIADYDPDHYIFRHKSFREFLAGLQLAKETKQPDRIESLVAHFKDDWWEETLRFFISKSDDEIFDRFIHCLFQSGISEHLDDNKQTLLQNLIREAPQKKIDALVNALNSDDRNDNRKRYVMDCLKTIGTPEAIEAIHKADKEKMAKSSSKYADDIVAEASVKVDAGIQIPKPDESEARDSYRNPIEGNVEYIKIPGGTYKYSVTGKTVKVPELYFCKYPVTNKRFRRFISFLEGREKEFIKALPLDLFQDKLLRFTSSIKGYTDYLGKDGKQWPGKLRSHDDDNKNFNGDDQPVVSVTWYAARAYCFWLSCLEAAIGRGEKLEDIKDINRLASIYRLPMETEWEWAAGGEPDGTIREYPWSKDKRGPNPNLANYDGNVGATTPVGRYPEGATPHGLMDMAGNVWEWMENYYDKDEVFFALRGGSWGRGGASLRCSARDCGVPDVGLGSCGFRVLRAFAPSL